MHHKKAQDKTATTKKHKRQSRRSTNEQKAQGRYTPSTLCLLVSLLCFFAIQNVARGTIRILAQPRQPRAYQTIPRDYVSGCKLDAATNLTISLRPFAYMQGRYPTGQVLV